MTRGDETVEAGDGRTRLHAPLRGRRLGSLLLPQQQGAACGENDARPERETETFRAPPVTRRRETHCSGSRTSYNRPFSFKGASAWSERRPPIFHRSCWICSITTCTATSPGASSSTAPPSSLSAE